ncbi:MAG: hypothetical protein U9N42_09425, partial [Campylobacterota bacterium]|nr:hypothetical protein [Campylobacterota bacterium]
MMIMYLKLLLLTVIISTLFSQDEYVINFNKPLHVDGNELKIVSGVIVKSALSKTALQNRLHVEVKELAFLQNSNLYLVDSNNSLQYSQELALKDYIIYAQPNMLQKVTSNKKESYDISDVNLTSMYSNAKGSGIKIAIIDDGFNLKHEDLKGLHVSFEYDATSKNM